MWKKWFGKEQNTAIYDTLDENKLPKHIAIIMDGNGRWAKKRGMPRVFGHRAGAESLREIITTASDLGVRVLTAYAFSTENWKRPKEEVDFLMGLLSEYLDNEIEGLHKNNVKIRFIGNINELVLSLRNKMESAQQYTSENTGLVLNLAVNYGGRAEIVHAVNIIAERVAKGELLPEQITEETIQNNLYTGDLPDIDLMIRPSGDYRISNFLLWQSAYAEFWFTEISWPEFKPEHLVQAIADFQKRERRFGGLIK